MERLPGSAKAMMEQCQRLFRALKEAQLTKMDLRRSSPEAIDRIAEVLGPPEGLTGAIYGNRRSQRGIGLRRRSGLGHHGRQLKTTECIFFGSGWMG